MSGNKMTDAKDFDVLDVDSGIQSGVLYDDEDSGVLRPEQETEPPKSDDDKLSSINEILGIMDSGVVSGDICELSEAISDMNLIDYKSESEIKAEISSTVRPEVTDLPLELLFQQDEDGDTQLHIAAVHGYRKPVVTLIQVCPNKELLNVCNDYGETPLHLAVMSQDPVITRMLVLAGADIGIRDRRGETPLHKATALSNVECMQALLIPVQEHQRKHTAVLNQKNYNGQACVHLAATLGHIESLQTLLFYGADINSREHLGGSTALHIAARQGDARLVAALQRVGADQRARDYARRTPRRLARHSGVAHLFTEHVDSDEDTDTDDDMYDEEVESLFEKYSSASLSIVA